MTEILRPDICVIGAGSGGLAVAAAAAAFGVPVVLIEKGTMGGNRLNAGCVPSKALIAAARRAQIARGSAGFGVNAGGVTVDFGAVQDHVQGVIKAIAPNDSRQRFTGLGVRVIGGEARFKDRRTVAVGATEIMARRFVIATGSVPAIPQVDGLDSVPYLTTETIFALRECPQHLIVIGAGPIGLECAQAFHRLGAAVTVLEPGEPLAKEDSECAATVVDRLEREGVAIRSGISIARVGHSGSNVKAVLKNGSSEEVITASHIFVDAGRRADVGNLGLEAAGIRHDENGIAVNKGLRTGNRRVYAIGDAAGGVQFAHLADYHAGLAVRNALFRLPVAVNNDIVPRVTFTDPELAHVGLDESAARKRHTTIRVLRWPFYDNDRAQIERDTAGHIKVVTTKNGKILGATIVGKDAGELIASWALACSQGINIRHVAGMILPYPTRSEAGKRAAIDFFGRSLTSPWVRRIIGWLRRFG